MRSLDSVLESRPTLIEEIVAAITPATVMGALRRIADTPAPSGASSFTRGPVVESWCQTRGLLAQGATFQRDAFNSGGDILSSGEDGIAILAHLDEVSYLLREPVEPGLSWVVPYCYHLAEEPVPARIVRFSADGSWRVVCDARLSLREGRHLVSHPVDVELGQADRVVLASALTHDEPSGRVTGSLDNAAGVAAALTASEVMLHFGIPFNIYMTDEEEGPSGASSQTICRGASRLLRQVEPAPLTVAVDIHGLNRSELDACDNHWRPWGASLAEYSSGGKGSVARPDIIATLTHTFGLLSGRGIRVRPNVGGHVPRSDDVAAMLHSNRVVVLGYPGVNRHFDRGLPAVNVHDLVDLARALVVVGALVAPKSADGWA